METKFEVARIYRFKDDSKLRALVDVTVNDCMVLRGIRVIKGISGLFVTMPQEQGKDKKWYDNIRFINKTARLALDKAVLNAYGTEETRVSIATVK